MVQILILRLCFVKVLTHVKGPSGRLGPNVLKSVPLREGAAQTGINACVTAAVALVVWKKVSPVLRKSKLKIGPSLIIISNKRY